MPTINEQDIIAIAEAACEAGTVSDLGYYESIRDRFTQQEEMIPIVREAVSRSRFEPGDTDCWDLATSIADQIGEALAVSMVQQINDEIEGMFEERDESSPQHAAKSG